MKSRSKIFYSSKNTNKTSLFQEPFEIDVGQLITIPADEEFLPMQLANGEVAFEFGFVGDNEKSLKQFKLIASDFDPKRVSLSENKNSSNQKRCRIRNCFIKLCRMLKCHYK